MAHYDVMSFLLCCSVTPEKVIVLRGPEEDGARIFGLSPKRKIIDFIGNGGLESLVFVNTKVWDNNYDKSTPMLVDAYEFRTLNMLGYIAFVQNPKTQAWIVKSFHLSDNDPNKMLLKVLGPKRIGP